MHTLVELFGAILTLVIVAAGIVMMFNAKLAWQMLKNAGLSLGLFVLGSMLLQSSCASVRSGDLTKVHWQ
jgi:low affinity Fe/Cu permease